MGDLEPDTKAGSGGLASESEAPWRPEAQKLGPDLLGSISVQDDSPEAEP